jgi:hypothetical protein
MLMNNKHEEETHSNQPKMLPIKQLKFTFPTKTGPRLTASRLLIHKSQGKNQKTEQ